MYFIKGNNIFDLIYSCLISQKDKCKYSTPKKVETCPQSESDIQERARLMKCDSYPECHGEELVYHCVRFKTYLVEVCAPNFRIVCGYESGTYIMMQFVCNHKKLMTFSNVENKKKILQFYECDMHSSEAHKYLYRTFYLDINLNVTFFTYQYMYK